MSASARGNSRTFSLGGPYDLLGKLYSDVQTLYQTPRANSSLRAYHSINCFLTLWHMTDWFWVALRGDKDAFERWRRDHPDLCKKQDLQKWLCRNSTAMRVAQQVATAAKHVHVDYSDPGVFAEIEYVGKARFRTPKDVVIRVDGSSLTVEEVVADGREFWQGLLNEVLPEDEIFSGD